MWGKEIMYHNVVDDDDAVDVYVADDVDGNGDVDGDADDGDADDDDDDE